MSGKTEGDRERERKRVGWLSRAVELMTASVCLVKDRKERAVGRSV